MEYRQVPVRSESARSVECADGTFQPVFGTNLEANRIAYFFGALGRYDPPSDLVNSDNLLTELLLPLPDTLAHLWCNGNTFKEPLTELPALPLGLITLRCHENKLTKLPELPPRLTTLICYDNKLTELPSLPHTLVCLTCNGNQLKKLPPLPHTLFHLTCDKNPFKEPFRGWVEEFNNQNDRLDVLRERVNGYWDQCLPSAPAPTIDAPWP